MELYLLDSISSLPLILSYYDLYIDFSYGNDEKLSDYP